MTQTTPFSQVDISLTAPVNGQVGIVIGNTTYYVGIPQLRAIWNGRDESILRDYLLCQMALVLQQAGVNPLTATNQQMATAITAQQYWV